MRKARAAEQASASHLKALRDDAHSQELAMAREQKDAEAAFAKTKELLAAANGALARLIEAERQACLAGAADYAAKHITFAGRWAMAPCLGGRNSRSIDTKKSSTGRCRCRGYVARCPCPRT